ncbi:MAG: hypothetical protein HYV28_16220 [Ignavibacteriales bacterium]|nr:hypothetical protein [Ignavibacteriales bacterium]
MKRVFYILCATATLLFGSAFLDSFTARTEGDGIRIEWKTGDESNLNNFVIERKTINGSFFAVATVQPKGSNSSYSFVDQNIYKNTNSVFVYRLKIVDKDNSVSFSRELSVSHNISGLKKSWGSIKALFR